jgi:transcriptional regulator with XRE-family HTH domain
MAEVFRNLPLIVREARRARGVSGRAAARQMGVDFNTLARLERGHDVRIDVIAPILRWLDQSGGSHG